MCEMLGLGEALLLSPLLLSSTAGLCMKSNNKFAALPLAA